MMRGLLIVLVWFLTWATAAQAQSITGLNPLFEFHPVNGVAKPAVVPGAGATTAMSPFRALLQGLPGFNFESAAQLSPDGGKSDFENLIRGRVVAGTGGDVAVKSAGNLVLKDGVYVPVEVTSAIPKNSALRAIGKAAGNVLPYAGLGMAVYELITAQPDWSASVGPDKKPLIMEKELQDNSLWVADGYNAQYFQSGTAAGACTAAAGSYPWPSGWTYSYVGLTPSGTSCSIAIYDASGALWSYTNPGVSHTEEITATWQVRTAEQWATRAQSMTHDANKLAAATIAAMAAGQVVDVIPKTVTGPAETTQRTTSTTTNPDGSTSSTKEKDKLIYNPSPITSAVPDPQVTPDPQTTPNPYGSPAPDGSTDWSPSVSTTTVTNIESCTNGSCNTTTTETESNNPPTEQKTPVPVTPTSDLCKDHPEILACKTLEEPKEEKMPTDKKEITLKDGPSFGGGSCIPDVVVTVFGNQVTVLSMAVPCGWIENLLKPLILLMAAISAAFIVMPRAGD